MTLAHLAPQVALLAAGTGFTALVLREGHRGRHKPGHGRTRPHSAHVGTAQQDHDAIKENDMSQQQPTAIVCYAQCESCQWGHCYDPPQLHRWAGPDDIEHAQDTGRPEPTGTCACPCAHPTTEGPTR